MAIVQISKIQQRAGNLVDLPQLDNGEFGWATDTNRLFIGKTGNVYADENIEVLTSYSNISFSQIEGSDGGNFNITTPLNGQILTYVSSTDTWENYSGNTSQFGGTKLQLGSVSNISMTGGAIGYVLETDGLGNLSWTPKGTLYTDIKSLTNNPTGNIITMTVANTVPYTNNALVTISGVVGTNVNTIINGQSFYVQLDVDYPTSGNVKLYTTTGNGSPANGAGLTATANTGIATSLTGGSGGGGSGTGGTNTTVQFNDSGIFNGNAGFTFDKLTTTLTVSSGNIITGNINATSLITAPRLVSNIATGTAPLTVTSTTRVANLNVSYANVSDYLSVTFQTSGTYYPLLSSATSGNVAQSANAGLSFNAATGALTATLFTGTLTTAAQPNITSTGTLTSLSVTGNISAGNVSATTFTGALTGNATTAGTVITAAQGNITSVGTLTGLGVNGTITGVNITANTGVFTGNGSALTALNASNISSGTLAQARLANASVTLGSTALTLGATVTTVAGLTSITSTSFVGALTGAATSATTAGTVTTAAQPNITSVGTLTSLNVVGTTTGAAFTANTGVFTGNGSSLTALNASNVSTGTLTQARLANASVTLGSTALTLGATVTTVAGLTSVTSTTFVGALTGAASSATTAGTVTTAAQPNITSVGTLSGLTVSATITGSVSGSAGTAGSATTAGTVTTAAQPNITSVSTSFTNLTFANAQTISGNNLTLSAGSNVLLGTITGNWALSAGSRLNATYADLAEYYEADKTYEPGTILEFGGDKEVTLAEDCTTRVAGVVSTNPAYIMNSLCLGTHTVAIALQGRVPTKVRGKIHKGDMLVSGGNGFARPVLFPILGTVIGKALENFEGEGIIEVAISRM